MGNMMFCSLAQVNKESKKEFLHLQFSKFFVVFFSRMKQINTTFLLNNFSFHACASLHLTEDVSHSRHVLHCDANIIKGNNGRETFKD